MAVKTVTGKLTTPDNVNVGAALVQARLSAQAVVASTNEVAPGVLSTLTASDGSWSLSLQSNLDLTPNTTYYTISVGNLWTATVVVPASAGPFKIEDVMAAPPAVSPPAALDSLVVHLANTETITGVKHFSATPVFDAGFTVSAGSITLPANSIADAALSTNVDLLNGIQSITAVKTFSAAPVFSAGFASAAGQVATFGTGDSIGSGPVAPQVLRAVAGTAASPDTTALPLAKFERTMKLTVGQISGDGSNVAAALAGINSIPVDGEVQGIGLYGWASTASTSGNGSPDAAGVYAVGQTTGTSTRVGIGLFAAARILSTSASAHGSGIQIAVRNDSGFDHSVAPTGFSQSQALWAVALGTNLVAAAYEIGNPFGQQFDVGLHNNAQVNGGLTGGVKTAFIQDDGVSLNSLLIKGTHSSGAVVIASGSGTAVIGGTSPAFSPALLEVRATAGAGAYQPLAVFSHPDATGLMTVRLRNGSGSSDLFASGSTNGEMTGTIAGDTGVNINTANKFFHIGPSGGSVLRVGQNSTLTAYSTLATPAGGSTTGHLDFGTTPALGIYFGSGAPTVSAPKGSLYLRTDGTTTNDRMYVNTNASTTWTAVTTAA